MVFSDYTKRRILLLRDRGKRTKEISELLLKEDIRSDRWYLATTPSAEFYGVPFVSKLKEFEGLRFMLVFTTHDAGIYDSCWYLRRMVLVFMIHAGISTLPGIYDSCSAGIYTSCWYLRFMLVFTIHAGIYDSRWYL